MPNDTSLETMLSQYLTWLYERDIDRTYERLLSSRGAMAAPWVAERLESPELAAVWLEETCPSVRLPLPPAPPGWPELPETAWFLPEHAVNAPVLWFEESAPGGPEAEVGRRAGLAGSVVIPVTAPGGATVTVTYADGTQAVQTVPPCETEQRVVFPARPETTTTRILIEAGGGAQSCRVEGASLDIQAPMAGPEMDRVQRFRDGFDRVHWTGPLPDHRAWPPVLDPRLEGDNTARVEAALQEPGQHDLSGMSLEQVETLLDRVLEPLDASKP